VETFKFHKSFKLNGISFSSEEEILKYAQSLTTPVYQFLKDWFSKDDFIIVKTSGSTGKPKKIALRKEFMINSAKATGHFFNLKENTTVLLCLSTDYIAGKMMLVRALTLGWELDVVMPVSSPLQSINKNYDFSAMVPLQLEHSMLFLHRVKKLIVGGGVVSVALQNEIQQLKTEVFATYGMTETITHIAVKRLNHVNCDQSFYKILPNITIYKDDRNCLLIKAPKITNEFIITNDVVTLISDKEFTWVGRYDNVINSGGIKLFPEKIEEKLSVLIKNRFFVVGIKDASLGEKLILLIEGNKKVIDFTLIQGLSKYEIPKNIYFISKFIETETKKIQRLQTLDLLKL